MTNPEVAQALNQEGERCPTCGSDDPRFVFYEVALRASDDDPGTTPVCLDPFHADPAPNQEGELRWYSERFYKAPHPEADPAYWHSAALGESDRADEAERRVAELRAERSREAEQVREAARDFLACLEGEALEPGEIIEPDAPTLLAHCSLETLDAMDRLRAALSDTAEAG